MDTATSININAATGGAVQLNNTNAGGLVLLFSNVAQGPTTWRHTTLTIITASMDSTGNLFCNFVSNYGSLYVTKTIN